MFETLDEHQFIDAKNELRRETDVLFVNNSIGEYISQHCEQILKDRNKYIELCDSCSFHVQKYKAFYNSGIDLLDKIGFTYLSDQDISLLLYYRVHDNHKRSSIKDPIPDFYDPLDSEAAEMYNYVVNYTRKKRFLWFKYGIDWSYNLCQLNTYPYLVPIYILERIKELKKLNLFNYFTVAYTGSKAIFLGNLCDINANGNCVTVKYYIGDQCL
jgi:hypothetical protein